MYRILHMWNRFGPRTSSLSDTYYAYYVEEMVQCYCVVWYTQVIVRGVTNI